MLPEISNNMWLEIIATISFIGVVSRLLYVVYRWCRNRLNSFETEIPEERERLHQEGVGQAYHSPLLQEIRLPNKQLNIKQKQQVIRDIQAQTFFFNGQFADLENDTVNDDIYESELEDQADWDNTLRLAHRISEEIAELSAFDPRSEYSSTEELETDPTIGNGYPSDSGGEDDPEGNM